MMRVRRGCRLVTTRSRTHLDGWAVAGIRNALPLDQLREVRVSPPNLFATVRVSTGLSAPVSSIAWPWFAGRELDSLVVDDTHTHVMSRDIGNRLNPYLGHG